MKVALVHDYLTKIEGGERVLQAWSEIWPQARVYTSFYDHAALKDWLGISKERIHTNFISKLPLARVFRKHYTPLFPLAFKMQKLAGEEVILSSSSFSAKFVHSRGKALNIAYLHTPPKFLYDLEREEQLFQGFDKFLRPLYTLLLPPLEAGLRFFDKRSLEKVDFVVCNSRYIKKLIDKIYGRDSLVIYPPVDTEKFCPKIPNYKPQIKKLGVKEKPEGYFIVVSRLVSYKRVDIVIEAFNKLGLRLKVVGDGPLLTSLKTLAKKNVEFLGTVSDEILIEQLRGAQALVFPTRDDLGLVPLEAQAVGKPVLAFRAGGVLETVVEGKTGLFFDEQTGEAIIETVKNFDPEKFPPEVCREQAEKFSKEEFKKKFKFFVEEAYFQWKKKH